MGATRGGKDTMILDAIYNGEFSLVDKAPPSTAEYKQALARFKQALEVLSQGLTAEQNAQLEEVLSSKNALFSLEEDEQFKVAFSAGVQLERETREISHEFN